MFLKKNVLKLKKNITKNFGNKSEETVSKGCLFYFLSVKQEKASVYQKV